jgi:hypothetical protein
MGGGCCMLEYSSIKQRNLPRCSKNLLFGTDWDQDRITCGEGGERGEERLVRNR